MEGPCAHVKNHTTNNKVNNAYRLAAVWCLDVLQGRWGRWIKHRTAARPTPRQTSHEILQPHHRLVRCILLLILKPVTLRRTG